MDQEGWQQARPGLEVKLLTTEQGIEQFILCRSPDRAAKERAMLQRQLNRLQTELDKIHARLKKQPERDLEKVGRRIGRWLGSNPAAARILSVRVGQDGRGRACGLSITERTDKLERARLLHGTYLLRTNHPGTDPAQLWRWYMQLTQAQAAFRTSKSDLRPIFHQKTERVEGHILLSFLSLALWRVLEQWMRARGLGDCARQLLLQLDELRSLDVVLPVRTEAGAEPRELRLRVVARPEPELAVLLERLGLELPQRPRFGEGLKM